MTDNKKVIHDVYHHPIIGYGSIKPVYKEVKFIDNNITLNAVKEYLSKLPTKQMPFKSRGYNSFVAKAFLEQIHLDIADLIKNAEENDGYRYGLAGVDVFSRYGWLVPMKTKQPHAVIKEIMKVIGAPKSTFSDMEGSIVPAEYVRVLN